MEASDMRLLKKLEEGNSRPEKMYADLAFDSRILLNPFTKKLGSAAKRQLSKDLVAEESIFLSRSCKLGSLTRRQYYQSIKDARAVIDVFQDLAFQHPSCGFRNLFAYVLRGGHVWKHQKVYRVYKELKLHTRRKAKRILPERVKEPLKQANAANQVYRMDFTCHSIRTSSRKSQMLNVIDDITREALAIEIDTSLSAGSKAESVRKCVSF